MLVGHCPRSCRRRGDELSPFKIALGFVRQFRSLLCTSPIGVCGEFRMMGIEVVLKYMCKFECTAYIIQERWSDWSDWSD